MRRTLIAVSLLSGLVACGDGEGPVPSYIHAQVGGSYWSAPASEGVVVFPGAVPDGPGVIYTAAMRTVGGGTQILSLDLPNPPSVGSYPLDDLTAFATFASCPTQNVADCAYWTPVPGHPGTLAITHIEPTTGLIEGTFVFTGYLLGDSTATTKSITQGQFSILAPSVFILE